MLSIADINSQPVIKYITIAEKLDGSKVELFRCDSINLPENLQAFVEAVKHEFKEIKTFKLKITSKVSEIYV